jgi:hypothetical protein
LHEASGGMHLLPLVRLCMQDIGAVLQMGSGKSRVLFGCSVSFDFFQAQNSCWYNAITFLTCVSLAVSSVRICLAIFDF